TYARSCLEYLQPAYPKRYSGQTGSGLYRIANGAQAPYDVYCDMESDGGGWTRIVNQVESSPVTNWYGGVSGPSYVLGAGQIPAHTQTAFGKSEQATYIDYVNWTYQVGRIHPAQRAWSPKTGRAYDIHVEYSSLYDYHDPECIYRQTPPTDENDWTHTLTV